MKKFLLILGLLIGLAPLGAAQSSCHNCLSTVEDSGGHPISNAIVRVYVAGTCPGACTYTPIFSDFAETTSINQASSPVVTDAGGNYTFYIPNGYYDIQITARGVTTTYSNVVLPSTAGGGGGGGNTSSIFNVESFPPTCVVNAVSYSTQFDCAFATAYMTAQNNAANQTLQLGNAVYLTNVGMQQSGVNVVQVQGVSQMDTTEGLSGGSVVRLNSTLATPMMTFSNIVATPLRSSTVYKDFLLDANHNAPACLDVASFRESTFKGIACENAAGSGASSYWVRFGNRNAGFGQNYDMHIGPIKIVSPYATTMASVTANVVTGAIATNGYTVSNGSTGYLNGPSTVAYLIGYRSGSNFATPCSTMPTGLHATISGGVVTAVSSSTGASGCTGTVYVAVPDLPAAQYGFYNGFTTDSTFTDIIVEGVGNVAAIYDAGNAANVWIHPHQWQYQPVGLESHGAGTFYGLQCDQPTHYCADLEGPGAHMVNTLDGDTDTTNGASMYLLGAGNFEVSLIGDYAPGGVGTDSHHIVTSASGPIFSDTTGFAALLPTEFRMTGFQGPNVPTNEKFNLSQGLGTYEYGVFTLGGAGYFNSPPSTGTGDPNYYIHFQNGNASVGQDGTFHTMGDFQIGLGGGSFKVGTNVLINNSSVIDAHYLGALTGVAPAAALGISLTDHSGTLQSPWHLVQDSCTLGTSCAVTLSGGAVFTGASTYSCNAQDTSAAAATKIVQSSGSAFTITGTGTDTIQYSCVGY